MFTPSVVKNCLRGFVGIRQPDDPEYPLISDALTSSTSNLYIQDIHPTCTIENIYNSAPEFRAFNYPEHDENVVYKRGQKVKSGNDFYVALQPTTAGILISNTDYWLKIDPFSDWLQTIMDRAANNLIHDFVTQKKLGSSGRTLVDSVRLYDGSGSIYDLIVKNGRFVGFAINIKQAEGLQLAITNVGLQTNTDQEELNFYLYHSSRSEPLGVFPVELKKNHFSFQPIVDAIMGYLYEGIDIGGTFFFGYYEDDLEGQALNKEHNFKQPCSTCGTYDLRAFNQWSQYFTVRTIEVAAGALDSGNNLFDVSKVKQVTRTNFGMNLNITVKCDISQFICMNKFAFANLYAQRCALEFMHEIAHTTRMNAISDQTRALCFAALADKSEDGSFKIEYTKALKSMQLDFSGYNSVCMPCLDKPATIRRRTI